MSLSVKVKLWIIIAGNSGFHNRWNEWRFVFPLLWSTWFFYFSHPLTELKLVVLSIWCSRLGPNGWWRVAACTVHFAGRRNPMSQRRMRKTTWAAWTLPSAGGPKIHDSMSTDQRGKKKNHWMVLGYASVWSLITMYHHRHVFHLIINKTFKVSCQTLTSNKLFTVEYQHCSSFLIALHYTIPVKNSHVQWLKYEIYHILFKNPNSLIMACLFLSSCQILFTQSAPDWQLSVIKKSGCGQKT